MSQQRIQEAHFSLGNGVRHDIEVRRITPEMASEAARDIQRIGHAAYTLAFERTSKTPKNPLAVGAVVRELFDPGDEGRVNNQEHKIKSGFHRGVAYWAVYPRLSGMKEVHDPSMAAVVKTSHSYPDRLSRLLRKPNCFINDAITLPMHQRQGLASAGLYVALHDFEDDREVITDLFDSNPEVNLAAMNSLGLQRLQPIPAKVLDIHNRLEQTRYGEVMVGDARRALVEQREWLLDGVLL